MEQSAENDFAVSFSMEEKAKLFDEIAKHYYNANFGLFSKSQIDLLMFSIYLDKLIDSNKPYDDYFIGKQLGILQQNVRQMKKKKQLIYPRNYKWYEVFLEYSKNAVFDNSERIVISIPDPNVYLELQHAIEELGGYVEVQLNSKLLKISPGYFIELLMQIYSIDKNLDSSEINDIKKSFVNELNKRYLKDEEFCKAFTERDFLTRIKKEALPASMEILGNILPSTHLISKTALLVASKLFN